MITPEILRGITQEQVEQAVERVGEVFRPGEGAGEGAYPPWFHDTVGYNLKCQMAAPCPVIGMAGATLRTLIIGWNICEQYYGLGNIRVGGKDQREAK